MQQFDLSLWLQDKSRKVVTRDGRSVRIICTDGPNEHYQIVGFIENEIATFSWNTSGKHFNGDDNTILDLFFADEEKFNTIIDESKSYLKNTPKEQVEKDWKEIQDWYNQHFTNEKNNEEEELTEFEQELRYWIGQSLCNYEYNGCVSDNMSDSVNIYLKAASKKLLDLARKELKPEFDKEMDKMLAETDKVVYQKGKQDALKELEHCVTIPEDAYYKQLASQYQKGHEDALKDLPKWKDSWSTSDSTKPQIIGDCLVVGNNLIHISDLVNKLPKEE